MFRETLDSRSAQPDDRDSLAERVERILGMLRIRNAQEADLLALFAQPDKKGKDLTDVWLELEVTKSDLDKLVRAEIDKRVSSN